jgi:acyl-coenzyme A thioesterase PaaI-like protein
MDPQHPNKQPNSEMCFVCGRNNPVGLYMQFFDDGDGEVVSDFVVPDHYQSYPGIVHGGVIAAMLDEVVARVSMIGDPHHFMMSVKLQILYRHPVPVETQGGVYLPDGTLAAEAHMSLADVPKELLASTNPRLLNWKVD